MAAFGIIRGGRSRLRYAETLALRMHTAVHIVAFQGRHLVVNRDLGSEDQVEVCRQTVLACSDAVYSSESIPNYLGLATYSRQGLLMLSCIMRV